MDVIEVLKTERVNMVKKMEVLDSAITTLSEGENTDRGTPPNGRRRMSAAARRKISLAAKARWAKWKKSEKGLNS